MPLKKWSSKKVISENIRELYADNKKKGKERGAWWTPRPKKQIVAIALAQARKSKKK